MRRTNGLYYSQGHTHAPGVSANASTALVPEDKRAERGRSDAPSAGTTNNFNAALNFSGTTPTDDAPRPTAPEPSTWSANTSNIVRHSAAASRSRSSASPGLNPGSSQLLRFINVARQPWVSQYLRTARCVSDHSLDHSGTSRGPGDSAGSSLGWRVRVRV